MLEATVDQLPPPFNEYCTMYWPDAVGKFVHVIVFVDNPTQLSPPLGLVTVISLLGMMLNTALLVSLIVDDELDPYTLIRAVLLVIPFGTVQLYVCVSNPLSDTAVM
jgi:hypothetical protein